MSELSTKQTTAQNPQTTLDKLTSLKREAYAKLDQTLTFDSSANAAQIDTTIIMYEKCLDLINSALNFYDKNRLVLANLDDAIQTHSKLVSMQSQTTQRINKLKTERISSMTSVDEFLDIGDQILASDDFLIIDDLNTSEKSKLNDLTKATEVIRLDDGVQLFYIAEDGTVSTPSYPTGLSVYSFDTGAQTESKVAGFVRVGSWMYPLVPNESPAMKTNFNAYIFPNNQDETEKQTGPKYTFVGITLSDSINREEKQVFEDVLSNYSSLIYQDKNDSSSIKQPMLRPSHIEPPVSASTSTSTSIKVQKESNITSTWSAENIAQNLLNGAQYISQGVSSTTDYANKYIKVGSDKLKTNLKPNEQPVNVDPKVRSVMQNVRYGTHVSVRVSSYLLNKLSSLATTTAKTVAPHLKQGSTTLLTKTGIAGDKTNATYYVESVCTVAHGSIQGFGLVYDSLEQAAKTLAKNVTEETVTVVEHKYGQDAAKVTQNGLYSVGNVALSVNNFRNLKIVRTVAKSTAKEVISSKSSTNTAQLDDLNKMKQ